jgi:tetratricopeptide (TPR) repeat protein
MMSSQARLLERFPGIKVRSEIQAHALLSEFEDGIALADVLAKPTAEDLRWLGVCHFSKFNDEMAIAAYQRAIDAGCEEARINLAHSLAFVDRAEEITGQLEQVHFERLSLYDKVFYLRVKSLNDERNGQLLVALKQAEYAWRIVQGAPEFPLLAPQLLNQLGILHGRIGRAQRALWYLDRNLEIAAGEENLAVHLTRVRVLSTLGHHQRAREELASLPEVPEQYEAIMLVRSAELSWAEGNIPEAIRQYEDSCAVAQRLGQSFELFQASLELGTLIARFDRDSQDAASAAFLRAQEQISDASDRLLYRFREILLLRWERRYSDTHAADELLALSDDFSEMGLLQEQGWVDAHAAHYLWRSGNLERAYEVLSSLSALAVTLQNPAFLLREWSLMPDFASDVASDFPTIATRQSVSSQKPGEL